MHMLPPVSLPLHFVIALSLSLPWRKAGNPWLPSAIYRITIWAINFGTWTDSLSLTQPSSIYPFSADAFLYCPYIPLLIPNTVTVTEHRFSL